MDGQTFLDDLRDDHETPLSRLGSSKSVYALTGGEMDGDAVKRATAAEMASLASLLDSWAADAGSAGDDDATDLFERIASFANERAETLGDDESAAAAGTETAGTAIAAGLEGAEGTVARVGALAGGLLTLGKLSEQLVGFFVGDADRAGAETFREFRGEVESFRDEAAELLAVHCSEADWEGARTAASDAIESAYDWYVETLESMGVKPKNVC